MGESWAHQQPKTSKRFSCTSFLGNLLSDTVVSTVLMGLLSTTAAYKEAGVRYFRWVNALESSQGHAFTGRRASWKWVSLSKISPGPAVVLWQPGSGAQPALGVREPGGGSGWGVGAAAGASDNNRSWKSNLHGLCVSPVRRYIFKNCLSSTGGSGVTCRWLLHLELWNAE